jgi:outer membrane protein
MIPYRVCGRSRGTPSLLLLLAALVAGSMTASIGRANSDPFTGIAAEGGAGIGAFSRTVRSPYRGAGTQHDFLPMYLYEGDRLYFHSHSIGLKFGHVVTEPRFDVFLRRRFEGTPYGDIPASLAGMGRREPGIDAGASAQVGGGWGIGFAEVLHDVSGASQGSELRVGYRYPWRSGRLWLRPHAILGFRNNQLNNYYYGVRPDEAMPGRDAYTARGGFAPELGLYAAYSLTERWRILAGYTVTRLPGSIGDSPIVDNRVQRQLTVGLMYDLSPDHEAWPEHRPLIVRAYNGDSTDCHVLLVAEFRCTSTHTADRTGVFGVELGRPFIDRVNGWPVDVAGFVGLQRHREEGFQPDFWSIRAYVKTYFYGFPWDRGAHTHRSGSRPLVRAEDSTHGATRPRRPRPQHLEDPQHLRSDDRREPWRPHRLEKAQGNLRRLRRLAPLRNLRHLAAPRQCQRRLELHLYLYRNQPVTSQARC